MNVLTPHVGHDRSNGAVSYLNRVGKKNCQKELLLNQRRDTATIDRLERMWTLAYVHGDTDLERCILAPDFTEIMRSGEVKFLQDELRFAENNKGKRLETHHTMLRAVLAGHGSESAMVHGLQRLLRDWRR